MSYGCDWSESFVVQLSEKEMRDAFVSDQVKSRIALLVRALREQDSRQWSQSQLGARMGKPQNVVSRLEDPDYGRMSLATLLEVAAAFDLPLWVDIPEWADWFGKIKDVPSSKTCRESFNAPSLIAKTHDVEASVSRPAAAEWGHSDALQQRGMPAANENSTIGTGMKLWGEHNSEKPSRPRTLADHALRQAAL